MIKKTIILSIALLCLGCGNTKYTCHFERGRMMDFSEGKWIMNEPSTNYHEQRIYNIALREFQNILGDSLSELRNLRQRRLLPNQLDLEPSQEELQDLKRATEGDFLITISANIVKDEMNSFPSTPATGAISRTNQAGSTIRIYDLNSLSLISKASVTGVAKVTRRADDNGINYVNNAATITMQGLVKLIKQYRKFRTDG